MPGFHAPGLELDLGWVIAASLLSIVGLALFVYGKRRKATLHLVAGVALMVYPVFISNTAVMLGIAVGICGFVWWIST